MSDDCANPTDPLDADDLRALAVLMAVYDQPLDADAIAARVDRLAAPGFDSGCAPVTETLERLAAAGYIEAEPAGDAAGPRYRIAPPGRDLATELGGRAPGQACDATRTCLLLRLCLDGTMPPENRRVLVTSLLSLGADAPARATGAPD